MMSSERLQAVTAPLKGAVLFGLIAGAARIVYHVVLRVATSDFLWTDEFVIWFAPAGHVIVFGVPAAILALIGFFAPRLVSQRLITGIFCGLALFSVLLLFPEIHHLASLALALGAGIQLSGVIATSRGWQSRLWMRPAAVIVGVAIIGLVTVGVSQSRAERRAFDALPPSRPDAPNVLVAVIDAGRARTMSLYGYDKPTTPNLERLGAEGVVFDHAIATTSWTLPSFSSMLTGHYPTSLSADWLRPLDGEHPTVAEQLQRHGYVTGIFSANLNYLTSETGLERGVMRFTDQRTSLTEMLLTVPLTQASLARDLRRHVLDGDPMGALRTVASFNWARPTAELAHERKPVQTVAREFLDWQLAVSDRPWFALLNFVDAHAPYKPQPPFDTLYGQNGEEGKYAGAIATIDRALGGLLDDLRGRGELDHTILIVTADHGELFGEHGFEHGNNLHIPLLHVPLLIHAPGLVPAGVRVPETVSTRDVAATIMHLVDSTRGTGVGGHSLHVTWADSARQPRSVAFSALTVVPTDRNAQRHEWRLFSIVRDSLHYVRNHEGFELLFDLRQDPDENTTLHKSETYREELDALRATMDSVLAEAPYVSGAGSNR
ncbi:MAG: sulfatase-like hydrolase/transferase [Gemmatimonadota bacterium]